MKKFVGVFMLILLVLMGIGAIGNAYGSETPEPTTIDTVKEVVDYGASKIENAVKKIASAIGIGVEKVFPYYVKQTFYKGVATLILLIGGWFVGLLTLTFGMVAVAKNWDEQYVFVSFIIVGTVGCLTALGTLFEGSSAFVKVMNPEYTAIRQLIADAGKLIGN